MPNDRYRLRKSRVTNRYFVVSATTGRKFSKKPLTKSRARRQQQALYASQRRTSRRSKIRGGCGCGGSKNLYGGCGCGGATPDYKRALALGAISGLVTRNAGVGVGVGLGSVGLDLIR